MGNARIIPIGNAKHGTHLAFGDECKYNDILVYAFIYVPRTRVNSVQGKLTELKKAFGLPVQKPLHCRVLFNPNQREKAGLGHLETEDARKILARAVTLMNEGKVFLRYATTTLSEAKAALGDNLTFHHESDGTTLDLPVHHDPKGLYGLLMNACTLDVPGVARAPKASNCEFFVSEEASQVKFVGRRSQQAHNLLSGFSDIGAPAGGVFHLQPEVLKADGHPLLELADIAAYLCAHAMDPAPKYPFFPDQLHRIQYKTDAIRFFDKSARQVEAAAPLIA